MDVQIARETLSAPVADALQYLQDNHFPDFKECQTTINFIRLMDKFISICNSYNANEIDPFKRALCSENVRIVNSFTSDFVDYLKKVQIINPKFEKKVPVLKSVRKAGFVGMIINAKSIQLMYQEYVGSGLMDSLPTYSTSQDHLVAFLVTYVLAKVPTITRT